MSSEGFESTFNKAADLICARLQQYRGVETVLDDLRMRVTSIDLNPLSNRRLIIEPEKISQQLRVSHATVEAVVEELHSLGFAHIWARAICPNSDPEDDNVIVETDLPSIFRDRLTSECPHCSNVHTNLSSDSIETFYALNAKGERQRFRLAKFSMLRTSDSLRERCSAVDLSSSASVDVITNWFNLLTSFFFARHERQLALR